MLVLRSVVECPRHRSTHPSSVVARAGSELDILCCRLDISAEVDLGEASRLEPSITLIVSARGWRFHSALHFYRF